MGAPSPVERHLKKSDDPSALRAFAAVFTWVHVWMIFPFLGFGVLWYRSGIASALSFWGGLGFLAPRLPQRDWVRRFVSDMRFWIDGTEIVGELPSHEKPLLYCHHPHGVLAVNASAKGGKDMRITAVAASLIFKMPLCRQMMELMGAVSNDKQTFTKMMKDKRDLAIIPGGVEEVVLSDASAERIYLKKRTGFVKYALEMGYDLVPVYHFGENELYTVLWPFTTPWFVRLRLKIAQKTQIAIGLGIGWWLFPNLPKRGVKCITVIGDTMKLPLIEKPTPQDVAKYHDLYVGNICKIYKEHRHRLPSCANKDLEVW